MLILINELSISRCCKIDPSYTGTAYILLRKGLVELHGNYFEHTLKFHKQVSGGRPVTTVRKKNLTNGLLKRWCSPGVAPEIF